MTPLTRLDVTRLEGAVIARVNGDVDLSNASELRRALNDAAAPDSIGIVVDMTQVGYVDSSGLTVLARLAQELTLRRQGLAVVTAPGSAVRRMFDLVQLDQVVKLHDSVEAAAAALGSTESA